MADIKISIVIPAYGRTELLRKAVVSCLEQDLPPTNYEVVVVDSSSDDENYRMVRELARTAVCRLVCLRKEPEGPGPSRARGALETTGEILAFMDSDCQADASWASAGYSAFADGEIGIVQGRTLPEPGAPYHVLNRSISITSETFVYETCNVFYRRSAYEEAGGFRSLEREPTAMKVFGGEDADLAWRVKTAGWTSRFATDALVTHVVERMSPIDWLFDKRMLVVPRVTRDFPESRQHFYAYYFFDSAQAWFTLALVGLVFSPLSLYSLALVIPYAIKRGCEQTIALRGPLRVLRVIAYFPKDGLTFIQLVRGSLAYRSLLL